MGRRPPISTRPDTPFPYTALFQSIRLRKYDGGAPARQDRHQMGGRGGDPGQEAGENSRFGNEGDRGPEAGHHPGREVGRQLQGARRHADRLQGDASPRADVRVSRPSGHDCAAARSRLPRREPEVVRRTRQLRDGIEGTDRRSEEHTSELQSLMRISYAVFCLKKKKKKAKEENKYTSQDNQNTNMDDKK